MCRVPVSQNLEIQTALNSQFYPKKKLLLAIYHVKEWMSLI